MEEKLYQQIRQRKIREMKRPTILMNEIDFDDFKKEVESKTTTVVGSNPTYMGIPIKTTDFIQRGSVIVYDDVILQINNTIPFALRCSIRFPVTVCG